MRNPQEYRDHAKAAEDMAASTKDHLLKTNFMQLARQWREKAEQVQAAAPKGLSAA